MFANIKINVLISTTKTPLAYLFHILFNKSFILSNFSLTICIEMMTDVSELRIYDQQNIPIY